METRIIINIIPTYLGGMCEILRYSLIGQHYTGTGAMDEMCSHSICILNTLNITIGSIENNAILS
jgi:hypothetical protein